MGLFSHKKSLSENIDGLLTTLNDTRVMQQLWQVQLADSLTDAESCELVVKCLKICEQ